MLAALLLMIYTVASIGATLNVSGGMLMGATGVDVNGILFDVKFLDGTCAELYTGCDENTDFPFTNSADLNDIVLIWAAVTALFDQVLIDSSSGAFDSYPILINGCVLAGACQINTPLFVGSSTEFIPAFGAFNDIAVEQGLTTNLDHINEEAVYFNSNPSPLFPSADASVFAVWNQTTVVPVPPALWLFLSGILGLTVLGNKERFINVLSNIKGVR